MIFGARRLAQRRAALVDRSTSLRRQIGAAVAPFAARAALVDGVLGTVRAALPWAARALTLYTLLRRPSSPKGGGGAT